MADAEDAAELRELVKSQKAEMLSLNGNYDIMEIKYKEEMKKRKKLHNDLEDMKGKIRVYCRVRPMSRKETEDKTGNCVLLKDDTTLQVMAKSGMKEYNFDTCFGPGSR